jgi:hypothetical protein
MRMAGIHPSATYSKPKPPTSFLRTSVRDLPLLLSAPTRAIQRGAGRGLTQRAL